MTDLQSVALPLSYPPWHAVEESNPAATGWSRRWSQTPALASGEGGEIRTLNSQGLILLALPLAYPLNWLARSDLNRLSLAYKTRAFTT